MTNSSKREQEAPSKGLEVRDLAVLKVSMEEVLKASKTHSETSLKSSKRCSQEVEEQEEAAADKRLNKREGI